MRFIIFSCLLPVAIRALSLNSHVARNTVAAAEEQKCLAFASSIAIDNATILAAGYHREGFQIPLTGIHPTCGANTSVANVTANICRIVFSVATSPTSATLVEGWLPDSWNDRTLSAGTGGIGGCVDYNTLRSGTWYGFATFATNAGHNGSRGYDIFLDKPEVLIDWSYRGVHVEAVLAKAVTEQYYGTAPSFNYYSSCSNGGRQAHTAATVYPDDFDGLLAGAPGVDLWRVVSSKGILISRAGWPDIESPSYISNDQFSAITAAQIALLDTEDGVKDGIIDDPASHRVDPGLLGCGLGLLNDSVCLSPVQVETARKVFQPIANDAGQAVFPAFEPGSPTSWWSANVVNGQPQFPYTILVDLFRSLVYKDPNWSPVGFNESDMERGANLNPAGSNQWVTDLSPFKHSGGKILVYHGRADPAIPSDNSARYFSAVQSTMNLTTAQLNDFYRLFYIPGMGHCSGGSGATFIGQTSSTTDLPDVRLNSTDQNALLALVDWVEHGNAPTSITGTQFQPTSAGRTIQAQRVHCLYPSKSVWNGRDDPKKASSWSCQDPASFVVAQNRK